MSDREAFLAQLRAGDEGAWRRLMKDEGRLVFFAARRAGVTTDEADDVFQVAFLSAYRAIDSLQNPGGLRSWLYRIAYRAAIDHLRKQRPAVDIDELGPLPDGAEPVDVSLGRLDDAARVRRAVGELNDRCRDLLTLLYLETPRPSYVEIAERLRMAVGSIGPTQARCLSRLADVLDVSRGAAGESSERSGTSPAASAGDREHAKAETTRRTARPRRSEQE